MKQLIVWLAFLAGMLVPALGRAMADAGGPYNARFLEGGVGLERRLPEGDPRLQAGAAFTIHMWVNPKGRQAGRALLFALGDAAGADCRCLALDGGRPAFLMGATRLVARAALSPGRWAFVAAVGDGRRLTLFVDGRDSGQALMTSQAVTGRLALAPPSATQGGAHFGGALVGATIEPRALPPADIVRLAQSPPNFDLLPLDDVGVGWEWQKQANIGLFHRQDAWTLPVGKGGVSAALARPPVPLPALQPAGSGLWRVNGWRLREAGKVYSSGARLSLSGVDTSDWHQATVPGTVLTTLVDRGVYPDPYYGLNNLAIPEALARQDYWYRAAFTIPPDSSARRWRLNFGGINYAGEIWINGRRAGATRGAFIRGSFAFEPVAGENVVAVRVSPPPHPGIPHEQSIVAGVGENGGQMAIDGPTFVASEGWDWIPGIRDRNTGLWQPVMLQASGDVRLLDPQVVTDLPLPRTDSADIMISVPIVNDGPLPHAVEVVAAFDDVRVTRRIEAPAGESIVRFSPAQDAALHVVNPRLWWPNGYGEPSLHDLTLSVRVDGVLSDERTLRFGIREVSYELSLFDSSGRLRRVDVRPTDGLLRGERLIDVRHAAIKQTPNGWAESLTPAGELSPAVVDVPATYALPHLALRVNGVRIAARGGSWGMDDAMKRVSRERLAPYFRLEREAHMNVVRNWMGNNTEPEFYDLADENGLMVLNDLWQSTQNFQVEPQDPALFLANARDVALRYRNHPSIVVWFGRNEGVPYPLLNEGLDDLFAELDGTRWYTGSSNTVNLQDSGPYNYRPPVGYFTDLASGFSVETGTPSLSTLEAIEASIPAPDRWPLADTFAYHDWHFSGNGDTRTFMAAFDAMFGPATDLTDFERKAQMMNLETHKAMVEGFVGHLWTKNSGRLFWMTHPSWPSNAWQLYSSDYDTHAAYYGAKKAAEPLHIQLNLPDDELVVVNMTREDRTALSAHVQVFGLDSRMLYDRTDKVDALANRATSLPPVPLRRLFAADPMLLVSLELRDRGGALVSDNIYWRGKDAGAYRALNALAPAQLEVQVQPPVTMDGEAQLVLDIANRGATAALNAKLTLLNAAGKPVLPAYYSDNYLVLPAGAARRISVRYPKSADIAATVALRGWNVAAASFAIPAPASR